MLKALIRPIIVCFLLLFNMALFNWLVNQLLGPSQKTLISSVQAQSTHHLPKSIQRIEMVTKKPIHTPLKQNLQSHHQGKPTDRLKLQFQSIHIHLKKTDRVKLENKLRHLDISPEHAVQIFFGPAPYENNISSPQTAKLRAQTVARFIYPYTQTVKMYYRPSIEEGMVIVEFFEPFSAKQKN
jgi:hypothetical protein